jgi:MATE family multidrug resistance protein
MIALPMAINQLCQAVLGFEDLFFVAHLGSSYLAAAALGNAYTFCLAYAASGLASALDTLISQAYGAKQYSTIGVVTNRALFVTSIACIPIGLLYWFCEEIFLLTRQDPIVARLSGKFVKWLIPGLWPLVMVRTLTQTLVNQNKQKFPMIVSVSSVIINLVLAYCLVWGIAGHKLGFIGAPIATSLVRIFQLILLLTLIGAFKLYKKTWSGIQLKATFDPRGLWVFMKLAVPGMFLQILDIWGFEITAFPAGIISADSLAAHSVIMNIYVLAFMIPLGLAIGGSVRVGMRLGSGKPEKARLSCYLTIIMTAIVQVSICAIIFGLRYPLAHWFSTDPTLIDLIVRMIPLSCSFQLFDAIQASCGGALRGMGKPLIASFATFVAYWCLGIPLGAFLAFFCKLKLYGLWGGIAIGAFLSASFQFLVILFVNWKKESDKAVQRSEEESSPLVSGEQPKYYTIDS